MNSGLKRMPDTICEIWFKGASCPTSNPGDRHLKLEAPNERIHIGRASKRHSDRGSPAPHNALYSSAVVSRDHAVIYFEDKKLTLLDMSSTHGTYVNGQRLNPQQPKQIATGDHITLGSDVKAATGQNHNSVSFKINFSFQPQARTTFFSEQLDRSTTHDTEHTRSSPAVVHPGLPADSEYSQHNSDPYFISPSYKKLNAPAVFCVPSDSDEMSEDSESDWYKRFDIRKSQFQDPTQSALGKTIIPIAPVAAPKTTTSVNDSPSLYSISSSDEILVDLPPLSNQEPSEGLPICVSHINTQQIKPESTLIGIQPPDLTTASLEVDSPALPDLASGALNDINSSREKLSIPNLLTSPPTYVPKDTSSRVPQVASSSCENIANTTFEVTSSEHLSVDAQAVDPQRGGYSSELSRPELYASHTSVRKRHADFYQETDECHSHKLEDAEAQVSAAQAKPLRKADIPARKRLCLNLETGKPISAPRLSTEGGAFGSIYHGSLSNTASFVLGTVIGGVIVLGGLITLPEALFIT